MTIKSHFDYDSVTRKITFNKEDSIYQFEKKVLAECGVDIDEIYTVDQYFLIRYEFRQAFNQALIEHAGASNPKTIEQKYRKALLSDDIAEVKRLQQIISKMRNLRIKVIK